MKTAMQSPSVDGRTSRRRRRSAEETRRLLLDAGVNLALDSLEAHNLSDGGPLSHIRVQDVVRHASSSQQSPVTTGALYNIWPSQSEYQADLTLHILKEGANPSSGPVLKLAAELYAQRLPIEEIGARLSDENFRLDVESRMCRAASAFVALSDVPVVREALRAAHETLLDSARELYTQLLNYGSLKVREPYTLDQVITVIGGLNDGLEAKHAIVPEQFAVPDGERSIVSTAVAGVFREFCEPR